MSVSPLLSFNAIPWCRLQIDENQYIGTNGICQRNSSQLYQRFSHFAETKVR